jgi:hypothetical protein
LLITPSSPKDCLPTQAPVTLDAEHIWSDGCAAQFKNKDQFHWLTLGATFGAPPPAEAAPTATPATRVYGPLRLAHHFFQSCHGKGPSDSEGAAVKCALRRYELLGHYLATTDDAFAWLVKNLTKVAPELGPEDGRARHAIYARSFHLIPMEGPGAVDHFGGPDTAPLEDATSSRFYFDSAPGTGIVSLCELSGDFCDKCWMDEECPLKSWIMEVHVEPKLMASGKVLTKSKAVSEELRKRGLEIIYEAGADGFCFAVFGSGVDFLEPVQLVDGIVHQGKVAIYSAFEKVVGNDLCFTFDEAARCDRKSALCGTLGVPPCFKRHVQTIPINSLRGAAFKMTELERASPVSPAPSREQHTFTVPASELEKARAQVQDDESKHSPSVLY